MGNSNSTCCCCPRKRKTNERVLMLGLDDAGTVRCFLYSYRCLLNSYVTKFVLKYTAFVSSYY